MKREADHDPPREFRPVLLAGLVFFRYALWAFLFLWVATNLLILGLFAYDILSGTPIMINGRPGSTGEAAAVAALVVVMGCVGGLVLWLTQRRLARILERVRGPGAASDRTSDGDEEGRGAGGP